MVRKLVPLSLKKYFMSRKRLPDNVSVISAEVKAID